MSLNQCFYSFDRTVVLPLSSFPLMVTWMCFVCVAGTHSRVNQCPVNEHGCLDVDVCLHMSKLCDGVPDCTDGWDEGPHCRGNKLTEARKHPFYGFSFSLQLKCNRWHHHFVHTRSATHRQERAALFCRTVCPVRFYCAEHCSLTSFSLVVPYKQQL